MSEEITTANAQHEHWKCDGDIEEDCAGGYIGVECDRGSEIESEEEVEDVDEDDGFEGTSRPLRMRAELPTHQYISVLATDQGKLQARKDHALVSCHGLQQPARTGDAPHGAVVEAYPEHDCEEDGAAAAVGGLVYELIDRHVCRCAEHGLRVGKAEQHNRDEYSATAATH